MTCPITYRTNRTLIPTRARAGAGGFTLVEMLAAVTTVSLILSSAAVTISSLHHVNRKIRDDFPAAAGVSRLAARFRADAHAARRVIPPAGEFLSTLQFELPDERIIEYADESGRVNRIERRGGAVVRRDAFPLPRGSRSRWTIRKDSPTLVEMSIDTPAGPVGKPGSSAAAADSGFDRLLSKFLACVGTDQTGGMSP